MGELRLGMVPLARFIAFEQEVEDDNAMSVGDATVQFGRLRLTLMLEKDVTAEWTAIGVAFVTEKRNDNHVRLDSSYIPPMLNANNSPQIYSMINDLHGLLVQRSQQIGGRLRQPGRFNTSELIEFTLLSLVNRHLGEHHLFIGEIVRDFQRHRTIAAIAHLEKGSVRQQSTAVAQGNASLAQHRFVQLNVEKAPKV